MHTYILRPGPMLVAQRWTRDNDFDPPEPLERDVADRAHEYLFETIEMDPRVTLADIFRLLDRDAVLLQVFRRDWAEELCAEARKGPVERRNRASASHDEIEWLELYQEWNLDTGTGTYLPTQGLKFHGIGVALHEDAPEHHRKKGERITWAVSLTSVRELLALPLRVNPEVRVVEDDLDSAVYGLEISRFEHAEVTLGQIVLGVLNELGFHGGPAEQAEFAAMLRERMNEVDSGAAKLVKIEDFLGDAHLAGCAALFDNLGGRSAHEINAVIRRIGDDDIAESWLAKELGTGVVVKAQFRTLSGREFRKAFRTSRR